MVLGELAVAGKVVGVIFEVGRDREFWQLVDCPLSESDWTTLCGNDAPRDEIRFSGAERAGQRDGRRGASRDLALGNLRVPN